MTTNKERVFVIGGLEAVELVLLVGWIDTKGKQKQQVFTKDYVYIMYSLVH
jgi:hypothetical protein